MPSLSRSIVATTAFAASATAAFNATSKTNVVTYWGQGANQQRLLEICQNPSIDIVNIGFVDVFPDQGPAGYPGDNFGNACYGDVYVENGVNTTLLKTCPNIGPDVTACQQTYGKKVFLSIGGGNPNEYYIANDTSGQNFAGFLWSAFGPTSANNGGPRPWGNAVVDGFDFDIESVISPAPEDANGNAIAYQTSGYAAMINHLKNDLYPQDTSKSYYISGSPQCDLPDVHFTTVMTKAWFDFLWIQFYNVASCSARAGVSHINGQGSSDISFSSWETQTSLNPNVMMYIGLPAAPAAAIDASYYLTPSEAQQIVDRFAKDANFGGVMLWEATYSANNTICGNDYASYIKNIVNAAAQGKTVTIASSCPTATSSLPAATPTLTVSPDGTCGDNTTYTCQGSQFGQCCSAYGFCGSTSDYCGANCNAFYGVCGVSSTSTSSTKATTTSQSSTSSTTKATTTSTSAAPSSTAICPTYDDQDFSDDNGITYTVKCGMSNAGAVIGSSSATVNLKQCMDACDKASGCKAANFQTGVNQCYFVGTLGAVVSNSTYNVALLKPTTSVFCPTYNNQGFPSDNGAVYSVQCGYSNAGTVIGSTSTATNLKQCMDACDKAAGCNAANFHTGLNQCYLIGELGASVSNSTYNVATLEKASTPSTTTPVASVTPSSVAVTFNELISTAYGESVYLVGSISQLGNWDTTKAVALSASQYTSSNPLWSVTVNLAPGTSLQYKFVKQGTDGTITWEADPNRSLTVPSAAATESASWQSASAARRDLMSTPSGPATSAYTTYVSTCTETADGTTYTDVATYTSALALTSSIANQNGSVVGPTGIAYSTDVVTVTEASTTFTTTVTIPLNPFSQIGATQTAATSSAPSGIFVDYTSSALPFAPTGIAYSTDVVTVTEASTTFTTTATIPLNPFSQIGATQTAATSSAPSGIFVDYTSSALPFATGAPALYNTTKHLYTTEVLTMTLCPGGCDHPYGPATTLTTTAVMPLLPFSMVGATQTAATSTAISGSLLEYISSAVPFATAAGSGSPASSTCTDVVGAYAPPYPTGPAAVNNGTIPSTASAVSPLASASKVPVSSPTVAPYMGGAGGNAVNAAGLVAAGLVAALML